MRWRVILGGFAAGMLVALSSGLTWAWADDGTTPARSAKARISVSASDDPESVLREALEHERSRQWGPAIQLYERALDVWPDRVDFRHRMRLCEAHFRLARRYRDSSFRAILLQMAPDRALELFDEILERIESHYVEPVSLGPLIRRGLDNMEVALRDPLFLDANSPGARGDRVLSLRRELQGRRDRLSVRTRAEARSSVIDACGQARQTLSVPSTPVIFEFIFGACEVLDDYSCCLTPDKLDDLYAVIDGNFVGLGVELKQDPAGLLLVGVIPGGPAAEAGLKSGECITHVGNVALTGQGLDEAASKLQGAEGSSVELAVRDKQGKSRRVRLTRRPVEVLSVTQARIVDATIGVGYVQLNGFQKTSTQELHRAIATLQRQGMRFLVLDLRGNPGGLLDVAVDVADEFLDDGIIVSTRGRAGNQNAIYRARPGAAWRMPVAVLVDHDSASASEILAGALKENRRALVVGEQSYGKGSVQSIFPLRSAPAGLKLTTAKFYSPRNESYSEHGVEPDLQVRLAARPTDQDQGLPSIEFGNPATDPVLERAIAQARRVLSVAR